MEPYPVVPEPHGERVPPAELTAQSGPGPSWVVPATLGWSWLCLAVAVALAPFFKFFGTIIETGAPAFAHTWSTGWGILYTRGGNGVTHGHAPRYGIVLAFIAAALIVAGLGVLVRRSRLWPLLTGAVASLVLATSAVWLLLDINSITANRFNQGSVRFRTDIGAGVWITVVAGGVGVALSVWSLVLLLRRPAG